MELQTSETSWVFTVKLNTPKVILLGGDRENDLPGTASFERSRERKLGFVEAQTCRLPKLDINGSEVIQYFEKPKPLKCDSNAENWAYIDDNRQLRIFPKIEEKYGKIRCEISYFYRVDDKNTRVTSPVAIEDGSAIKEGDYFILECSGKDQKKWQHLSWTVVANDSRVEALSQIKKPEDWSGLDVYFIGYNIVGDGTPQAFIPILTGSTEEELPLTRRRFKNAHYVDEVYPFVWNNFSDAGYITLYGEDSARVGTFTYRLKGFKNQPTDHYTRTFFQRAETFYKDMKCFGNVPMHKEWFRYVSDFMHSYKGLAPRFLLAFHSLLSHDSINLVQVADDDTVAHLKHLYETGELEKSLVIVMADHGNRFAKLRSTHQGQLEERLPFFAISLPKSFRETESGSIAYKNLLANKERLTTPFDIHATLLDIIHWPTIEKLKTPNVAKNRSLSLFREVPENRTCAEAGIEPHWCTCLNWESAMNNEEQKEISKMLALTTVKTINDFTEKERKSCAPLKLNALEDSHRLVPNEILLKYKNVKDVDGFVPDLSGKTKAVFAHYQIKFSTVPGNALYEATVGYNSATDTVTVDLTAISHVNKYGDLPHCVIDRNYFLAAYCVCYDKI
ncbi:unnamed protein product [Enterobius vermicularis]|uniref:DUF229 domain-containing protein n=1 Tax=Enterobius vermicularis TaxID=51028 RepID=A0A0N4V620_ENTVE|nr:unnamed protein product [Enterobius vermicularis]